MKKVNIGELQEISHYVNAIKYNNFNADGKILTELFINGRYLIGYNGVIYDTIKDQDIPQYIFKIRDYVME